MKPLSVFFGACRVQTEFYLKPPCFKQFGNQTAVDVKHSSHVKHRIRFCFDVNAKHRRTRNTAVMSLLMFLMFVCMFNSLHGSGHMWTGLDTVDVCVAMFLDESTEVRDNSACVTKDVRFQNSLTRQVSTCGT